MKIYLNSFADKTGSFMYARKLLGKNNTIYTDHWADRRAFDTKEHY